MGEAVARTAGLLGSVQIESAKVAEATATLEGALAELAADSAEDLRADLEARLCRAYMRTGRHHESIAAADRGLVFAERLGLESIVADALVTKGSVLGILGR
jgi:hypothetical protein